MPQFDITSYSSQIFWLAVVFGFLYFAVYKLLTPKAEQIFKDRQDTLEGSINDATNLSKKAEVLKESYNAGLKDIKETAESIRRESMASLDSSFAQKKLELAKELAIAGEKNSEELDKSVQLFRINEQRACASLAEFIIEKLTNKKADLELLKNVMERTK